MEKSQQILLNSLANLGVSIPSHIFSITDLTPPTFFSISSQSLRLIHHSSFPTHFPDSMADRFYISTHLSSALKTLGYIGEINFQKFMYPSEEDMYNILRFLLGRLSECCETATSSATYDAILEEKDATGSFHRDSIANVESGESLKEAIEDSRNSSHLVNHNTDVANIVISCQMHSSKFQRGEILLQEEATTNLFDMQNLKEQHTSSASAADMPFDVQHPSFHRKQLNEQADAKRHDSIDLESHGDALKKALEGKRRNLEDALFSTKPEIHAKLQKLKQIELEMQFLVSENKKRDDEVYNLSVDVEKQQKLAPRKSFIQRVSEISKNSRKQDMDVERILKDTRELQLESNSIQERLHRTYGVVDETVIREGKKDPVGQQVYRLLVSIHEGFAEMSEKILATDRTQREGDEFKAKLCAIASRSLDLGKLQADLDAIKKENEFLYGHLAHRP